MATETLSITPVDPSPDSTITPVVIKSPAAPAQTETAVAPVPAATSPIAPAATQEALPAEKSPATPKETPAPVAQETPPAATKDSTATPSSHKKHTPVFTAVSTDAGPQLITDTYLPPTVTKSANGKLTIIKHNLPFSVVSRARLSNTRGKFEVIYLNGTEEHHIFLAYRNEITQFNKKPQIYFEKVLMMEKELSGGK